jgi:heme/copper-type cytochrome/quinol oxidase subunit 2
LIDSSDEVVDMIIIAVIIVGGVILLAAVLLVGIACYRRSKKGENQDEELVAINNSTQIPSSAKISDIEILDKLGGGNFSEVFKGE